MSLESEELSDLKSKIGRNPTSTELQIVAAEWSEHCSYKSSKRHLKMLPMKGPLVINEKGYDSGVLDVGGGYVVTAHIESHNHPSAVEPYGGAATGVGGVVRDILSAGTRPIAIFDFSSSSSRGSKLNSLHPFVPIMIQRSAMMVYYQLD